MSNSQKEIAMLAGNGDRGNSRPHCNSTQAQCLRLLDHLRVHGNISTITARSELDILGVSQRIADLKHKHGHIIDTVWINQPTDGGQSHRVALYVYGRSL